MKNAGKILVYGLFTLVAVSFFLYHRFPSEPIRELLMAHIERSQPDLEVDTDEIRPTIPPGLKLSPLSVSYADMPIVRSDHLKVTPHLFSLLRDPKIVSFKGPLGSGEFNGRAEFSRKTKRPQDKVSVNLSAVPLEALEIFRQWPDYKADGELDARIKYDSIKGAGGTIEANLDIGPARISLDQPIMGISALEFTQIKAEIKATPRMLQIRHCEAFGNQLEGKISGSIVFRQPMGNSRITLSVTVKPQAAFLADHKNDMLGGLLASGKSQTRGIVFRIAGTLDNPSYVIR